MYRRLYVVMTITDAEGVDSGNGSVWVAVHPR